MKAFRAFGAVARRWNSASSPLRAEWTPPSTPLPDPSSFPTRQSRIEAALAALRNKQVPSLYRASKVFDIPKSTLDYYYNRLGHRETPRPIPIPHCRLLLPEEEQSLIKTIVATDATARLMMTQTAIKSLAREMLLARGVDEPLTDHWYEGLFRRHPDLSDARYAARYRVTGNNLERHNRRFTLEEEDELIRNIILWETTTGLVMSRRAVMDLGEGMLAKKGDNRPLSEKWFTHFLYRRTSFWEARRARQQELRAQGRKKKADRPPTRSQKLHPEEEESLFKAMDLWKSTNGSPMPPSTVMSLATEMLLKRGDASGVSAQWYRLFSQRYLKREKAGIAVPSRAPSSVSRRLTGEEEESLLKAIHEWEAASGTIIPTRTIRSLATEMLIAKGDPKPLGAHWMGFFLARHADYKEARYARLRNEKHARPSRVSSPQRKLPRKLTIEEEEALAKTIEAWETERDSPMTMAAIADAAWKILLARGGDEPRPLSNTWPRTFLSRHPHLRPEGERRGGYGDSKRHESEAPVAGRRRPGRPSRR